MDLHYAHVDLFVDKLRIIILWISVENVINLFHTQDVVDENKMPLEWG